MPSGAHTTQTTVMSAARRACSSPTVCAIEPPVASIGSSTITGCVLKSSGRDSRYGVGSWVSSLRATPTNPTFASGISMCALSTIPSPARSTGTSSGGAASRDPTMSAIGVRMGTGLGAASRVAS